MQNENQINIKVRNKIATLESMNFTLVGGNDDYKVVFDFDEEWNLYPVKTALFIYGHETVEVVFDGNTCEGVPIENATVCLVGVFADDIRTTTPACITGIELSIRDMATSLPTPPKEDVYNQIIALLNRYIEQGGGGGGYPDSVRYSKQQLTESQKEQARKNIGALATYNITVYAYNTVNLIIDHIAKAGGDISAWNIVNLSGEVSATIGIVFIHIIENIYTAVAVDFENLRIISNTTDYSALNIVNFLALFERIMTESNDVFETKANATAKYNELEGKIANAGGGDDIPTYVVTEAEEVADKVLGVRNANSFVMALASDLHTNGSDASSVSALHAGQGMDAINSMTQLDLVALLGDYEIYYFNYGDDNGANETEDARKSFKHVKKAFTSVAKGVPFMQLQGNHDQDNTDTTAEAKQKYYAYIGANNVGTVTDYNNKFRNYGYRDFENYKIRVIYLNTADVSEEEVTTDAKVSTEQINWLNTVALNLTDPDWGIIVLSHHPLNWYGMTNLLNALDTYKGKGAGAELIAHFHGHLHNFRAETLGTNKILTITIPNACNGRENEYGTAKDANGNYVYSENQRSAYGDTDASGNQRKFLKTANSANDTSFNVVVVDRENEKVHAICYGAGIDRVICFDGEPIEDDNTGEGSEAYTNLVPTSINSDGSIYNGTGYKEGYRLNSSGNETELPGAACSGYMPYKYEIIRAWGTTNSSGSTTGFYAALYDANFTKINVLAGSTIGTLEPFNGKYLWTINPADVNATAQSYLQQASYIRLSLPNCAGADLIVTLNDDLEDPTDGENTEGEDNVVTYKNWLPISTDENGNVFNGKGYETGKRFSSSGGTSDNSAYAITGFIPAKKGDVIRLNSALWNSTTTHYSYMQIKAYDASKTAVYTGYASLANIISQGIAEYTTEADGTHVITLNSSNTTWASYYDKTAYIRLSVMANACADGIITVNEEIT